MINRYEDVVSVHTLDGVTVINLETDAQGVPDAEGNQLYSWAARWCLENGGAVVRDSAYNPTPKQILDNTLASLVYEIDATRTIQVRPQDNDFISGEIDDLEAGVITSSTWIMLDNLPHPVTLAELKAAKLSGRAQVRAAYATYGATL